MKNKLFIVSFIAVLSISFSIAVAGHHYHGSNYMTPSWNMTEMDGNRDGDLSFEEFSGPYLEKLKTGFNMIDTNNDGKIDSSEWDDYLSVHGMTTN